MSSDSEDDYMSDKFISKSETANPLTTAEGLITNRSIKRKIAIEQNSNKYKMKSSKLLEEEQRDLGLNKELSSTNKGFAMLSKMGYKKGEGIGKSNNGIVEPIGIQLKNDRGGVGRDNALAELKQYKRKIYETKSQSFNEHDFRKRMMEKNEKRFMEIDLSNCQKVCEEIDNKSDIKSPDMPWFWTKREPEKIDDDDDDDDEVDDGYADGGDDNDDLVIEYEVHEKLEMLTNYLRTCYCYCHWCGTKYDDLNDMTKNCPGQNKNDH